MEECLLAHRTCFGKHRRFDQSTSMTYVKSKDRPRYFHWVYTNYFRMNRVATTKHSSSKNSDIVASELAESVPGSVKANRVQSIDGLNERFE